MGPIITVDSAPGLILATGNEGEHLEEAKSDTFVSVDGGVKFKKILSGSHVYQIGDQGSLIVAAKDDKAVTEISFSWNSGESWKEMEISEKPLFITNIVSDPANKGLRFLVYGVPQGDTYGFVIPINFEKLMPRDCKHESLGNKGESDYEEWIPQTLTNKCLNGEQLAYLRRKPHAECFNPDELVMVR